MFGYSNYPPGESGHAVRETITLYCPNPDCECEEWEAEVYRETGGYFFHDDDDADCPECGAIGEDTPGKWERDDEALAT